jgi:hypothetical protein
VNELLSFLEPSFLPKTKSGQLTSNKEARSGSGEGNTKTVERGGRNEELNRGREGRLGVYDCAGGEIL